MFVGFNSAVSGLLSAKRGMYVASHNIDNSPRLGYSKQLVEQNATPSMRLVGIGHLGTGTEITDITRARNFFTDTKYWHESAGVGEWKAKTTALTDIEKIMGEPSETSFRQYMDNFYDSLNDMTKNPGDNSYRQPVLENAVSFTKHINEVSKRLEKLRVDSEKELQLAADKINQIGSQITQLNRQIYMKEIDGHSANDLRDSREMLIDELSEIVNVNVSESADGKYDVSIAGNSLVYHENMSPIKLKKITKDEHGADLLYPTMELKWENGADVRYSSGTVKGLMDTINGDGENNSYNGIPFYEKKLSYFAETFADKFNEQHKKGYDLNGEKGLDFFVYEKGLGASNTIRINEEILKDVNKIAASSTKDGEGNIDIENNENIKALIDLRNDKNFFKGLKGTGTADDYLKSMLSSLGVDGRQSGRFLETQKLLQKNLQERRQSVSGVSVNEEVSDIIKYQKVYTASAKVINTLDTLMDLTVNRLGTVGR